MESLNLVSIPVIDEKDIESVISLFIVGLADREEDFNKLLNTISGESKLWSEDITESHKVLYDFLLLFPGIKRFNQSIKERELHARKCGYEDDAGGDEYPEQCGKPRDLTESDFFRKVIINLSNNGIDCDKISLSDALILNEDINVQSARSYL